MIALLANIKRSFLCFLAFTMFLLIGVSPVASALSAEQKRIFDSGIYYFDAQTNSSGCSGSTSLVGSVDEEKVWNFLTATKGLSENQAAGIMGNMQAEAHFEPRLVEYGWLNSRGEMSVAGEASSLDEQVPPDQNDKGQPGYGIVQWTSPGRKQGLREKAAASELPAAASDLGLQLDYLWIELETSYASVLEAIRATDDYKIATNIFLEDFERPGKIEETRPVRHTFAYDILTKFGSGLSPVSSSVPSSTTCDSVPPGELPPSGDAVTLCSQVSGFVKQGKVDFGHTNDKNNLDAGYVVRERGYGSAPEDQIDAKVPIDPQVCRMMIYLVNQGFTFRVSSMVGTHPWCTSKKCPSKHWTGSAVDVDTINGTNMGANPAGTVANVVKFMKTLGSMPLAGRPSQVLSQGVGGSGCLGEPGTYVAEIDNLSIDKQQPKPKFTSTYVECHMDHVHVGY